MDTACSTNEEKRNAYRTLVGKPERRRPLGRPRRSWVDNINMDIRETEWGGMDWIDLAQERNQWRGFVKMVMNLEVQSDIRKLFSSCTTGGFSRRAQLH
jgi:hypothetical protein